MKATILTDNLTCPAREDLTAEWGLAVYIEYEDRKILLDTGASGVFAENARKLGLPLEKVEAGVLSHAHYDHADGMADFFACNESAPFYLRKGSAENCYAVGEVGDKKTDPAEENQESMRYIGIRRGILEEYSSRIIFADGTSEIFPGVYLLGHKTPGLDKVGRKAGMYVDTADGWLPDSFDHEQSLVFETEKGIVIFNSCSHGGADNIINETAAVFPGKKMYALIGGFHLYESSEEEVRELAERIRQTGIEKIYTGHCTGQEAFEILKEELGDRAEQIFTGMEIIL